MIVFKSISYKNFMSVGKKEITVLLNDSKVLVVAGPNGGGKSILLATIYYALYGKSFSGVNLSSLINSINKKDLLVTLELKVNNVPVVIKRGMKPHVFEIYINGGYYVLSQIVYDINDHIDYQNVDIIEMKMN